MQTEKPSLKKIMKCIVGALYLMYKLEYTNCPHKKARRWLRGLEKRHLKERKFEQVVFEDKHNLDMMSGKEKREQGFLRTDEALIISEKKEMMGFACGSV